MLIREPHPLAAIRKPVVDTSIIRQIVKIHRIKALKIVTLLCNQSLRRLLALLDNPQIECS